MKTLDELMDEHEAELAAKARAEVAAEDAAWAALPPVEQDRILEERAATFADLMEYDPDADPDADDDEDC